LFARPDETMPVWTQARASTKAVARRLADDPRALT
jgi:hypothetical protein